MDNISFSRKKKKEEKTNLTTKNINIDIPEEKPDIDIIIDNCKDLMKSLKDLQKYKANKHVYDAMASLEQMMMSLKSLN